MMIHREIKEIRENVCMGYSQGDLGDQGDQGERFCDVREVTEIKQTVFH
jgi:hypothetical protein